MLSGNSTEQTPESLQWMIAHSGTSWAKCLALAEEAKCYRCDRCQYHRECTGELYSMKEMYPGIPVQTRLTPTVGLGLDI